MATKLDKILTDRGIKANWLAAKVGVNVKTMSNYQTGKSEMRGSVLLAMADVLNVDPRDIVGSVDRKRAAGQKAA